MTTFKVIATVLVCLTFLPKAQLLPDPSTGQLGGTEFFTNDKIYLVSNFQDNFVAAHLHCVRYGGSLVKLMSEDVDDFLRWAVPSVTGRRFWIGIVGDIGLSELGTFENLTEAYVDCQNSTNDDFCQSNVEGPHPVTDAIAGSCFDDDSCLNESRFFVDGSSLASYNNWASGEPSNDTSTDDCVVNVFEDCHDPVGCVTSYWMTSRCLASNSFICEKDACPDVMNLTPFLSPEVDVNLEKFLGLQTVCSDIFVRTTLNYCARTYLDLIDIQFGDPPDNICAPVHNGSLIALIQNSSCVADLSVSDLEQTEFTYRLLAQISTTGRKVADAHISRPSCLNLTFQCTYNNSVLSSSDAVNSFANSLTFTLDEHDGHFHAVMSLFPNDNFIEPLNGPFNVTVPDDVYVGVELFEVPENGFVVQVHTCIACPFLLQKFWYYLVQDSCPVDPKTTILSNYNGTKFSMKFASFHWTLPVPNVILLECALTVCDPRVSDDCYDNPSCLPTGNITRRRSIRNSQSLMKIRVGPIAFLDSGSCSKDNGGCSHQCSSAEDGGVECLCPDSMTLGSDGKTCEVENPGLYKVDDVMYEDLDFSDDASIMTKFFLIGSFCLTALSVAFVAKYRSNVKKQAKSTSESI
ncbi:unnamed protein product [Clavelina lepadiformis]|uniref:ZP domain-containing protein n=1 Tax=Clavelina lepadiformis TaxID=159417 RepID=A0ABP0FQG6_CLALP